MKLKTIFLLSFLSISVSAAHADKNITTYHAGKLNDGLTKYCDSEINISGTFQKYLGGHTIKMIKFDGVAMNILATATNHTDGQYIYNLQLPTQKIGNMNAEIKSVILRYDYILNKMTMTIYLTLPDAPPFAQQCEYVNQ